MREMNEFEQGERDWNDLPHAARQFYMNNYPHDQIMVGEDENGPVSLAAARGYNDGTDNAIGTPTFADGYNPYTQTSTDLAGAVKNVQDYWGKSKGGPEIYGNTPDTAGRSTVAGFTPDQIAAQNSARNAAGVQDTLAGTYANQVQQGAQGNLGYTPASSVNQYLNPLINSQQQQTIANVNNSFGQSGTFGSARNARASAEAAARVALPYQYQAATNDAAAQNQANQFNANQQYNYASQIPNAQDAQTYGSATLAQTGQQQQNQNQLLKNEEVNRFAFNQERPLDYLNSQVALQQSIKSGLAKKNTGGLINSMGTPKAHRRF